MASKEHSRYFCRPPPSPSTTDFINKFIDYSETILIKDKKVKIVLSNFKNINAVM